MIHMSLESNLLSLLNSKGINRRNISPHPLKFPGIGSNQIHIIRALSSTRIVKTTHADLPFYCSEMAILYETAKIEKHFNKF